MGLGGAGLTVCGACTQSACAQSARAQSARASRKPAPSQPAPLQPRPPSRPDSGPCPPTGRPVSTILRAQPGKSCETRPRSPRRGEDTGARAELRGLPPTGASGRDTRRLPGNKTQQTKPRLLVPGPRRRPRRSQSPSGGRHLRWNFSFEKQPTPPCGAFTTTCSPPTHTSSSQQKAFSQPGRGPQRLFLF